MKVPLAQAACGSISRLLPARRPEPGHFETLDESVSLPQPVIRKRSLGVLPS
jgi:hypothetical protein